MPYKYEKTVFINADHVHCNARMAAYSTAFNALIECMMESNRINGGTNEFFELTFKRGCPIEDRGNLVFKFKWGNK